MNTLVKQEEGDYRHGRVGDAKTPDFGDTVKTRGHNGLREPVKTGTASLSIEVDSVARLVLS